MSEPTLTFLDDDASESLVSSPEEAEPTLYIDDDDRYSRLRLIPWWRQEKLAAAKVLVVGAGALGNEVLKNLALLGVGKTYVIDLDVVDISNLSRSVLFRAEDGGRSKAEAAASRAREINPEVTILPIHGDVITDLGLGLFADVDVVIACLDNREARLWVNRQCWKAATPWVDSGIQEIQGVVKVFDPREEGTACYECAMTTRDYQLLNLRYSCPLLRRDQILEGKVPTAPTIASMMAALEVQEALKLIHGLPVEPGTALVFNGVTNQFYKTRLPFRDDCLSHESFPSPIEIPMGHLSTASAFFKAVKESLPNDGRLTLPLERDLVVAVDCPRCGWHNEIFRPRTRVGQSEAVCPNCHEPGRPEILSVIEEGTSLAERTLADLGVPRYDILRVDAEDCSGFFLLAADRDARHFGNRQGEVA